MKPTGERGKRGKPWLTGFWVVILSATLTLPAWAESLADLYDYKGAAITQNRGRTVTEPGEVNVLKDVRLDTPVASGPLLTSPELSKGRLQPYLTVGPALSIGQAEYSAELFPPEPSSTDTSVKVGAAWFPLRNIAIFGEYGPGLKSRDGAEPVTPETDVNTHHVVGGGISFGF